MSVWDKIKKNIIDSMNEAIDKTEELTSVGRIKMEILQTEHRLDEKFIMLGRYVFEHLSDEPGEVEIDTRIAEIKKEIENLEKELEAKEKELVRIREEDGIDFDS
ncbi:MAG: hypothetical protein P8184_14020 [Calditrichia bacterium]